MVNLFRIPYSKFLSGWAKFIEDMTKHLLYFFTKTTYKFHNVLYGTVSWWYNCEHIWDMYDISKKYRARLLLPLLTPKCKTVVSRMKSEDTNDVDCN